MKNAHERLDDLSYIKNCTREIINENNEDIIIENIKNENDEGIERNDCQKCEMLLKEIQNVKMCKK